MATPHSSEIPPRPRPLRSRRRRLALAIAACGLVLSLAAGVWIAQRALAEVSAYGFAASVAGLGKASNVNWPVLRWKARWGGFAAGFGGGAILTAALAFGVPRLVIRR